MAPIVVGLILAPFVGSFLGVLARRCPAGRSVVRGRSRCESCDTVLRPIELVPIVSFVRQRGRCRRCGAPIDPDHLRIELAAVLPPFLMLLIAPGLDATNTAISCGLGWWLLVLGVADWRTGLLPDVLTLPLVVAALAAVAAFEPPETLADHAAAAIAGWAILRVVNLVYRRARGRAGLGGGDAKLLAAGGAVVGLGGLGPVLLIGSVGGLLLAAVRHGRSARGTTSVPFGPSLALGIFVVFVGGTGGVVDQLPGAGWS